MPLGHNVIKGIFAVGAGVLTIMKGEAWIGRGVPPTLIMKGPTTLLIGALAIGVGLPL